jgi:hypothetical protein
MLAEEGKEEIDAGEIDDLRPTRRRLTLAPLALDEVLVEDVNDDETSVQGELPVSDNQFLSGLQAGFEVEDALGCQTPSDPKRQDRNGLEAKLREDFWALVGFPEGIGWWENSTTSADPGTKNLAVDEMDLGATNIIVESNNRTADLPAPHDKNGRVFLN